MLLAAGFGQCQIADHRLCSFVGPCARVVEEQQQRIVATPVFCGFVRTLYAYGRSSRTYVQKRPILVLPRPGERTGTGVSSAWTLLADITCRRPSSTSGESN